MIMKHDIVSPEAWETARKDLLIKEKQLAHARDEVSRARRALPWERVEKPYVFDGPNGEETLSSLFAGRSQLLVYHFMFAPEWEAGCKSCSFWADNFERNVVHLAHRDATMIAISRAPVEKLLAFQKRMGWTFTWVSSGRSSFNYDYRVSFEPGKPDPIYNYKPKTSNTSDLPGISALPVSRSAAEGPRRGGPASTHGMAPASGRLRCGEVTARGDSRGPRARSVRSRSPR